MSLTVLKPSTGSLITRSYVEALPWAAGLDPAVLEDQIAAANGAVCREIGRPLMRQQYRETDPRCQRSTLLLSRYPVDPLSIEIEKNGTPVSFTVESVEWGMLSRQGRWPSGVSVKYFAGYVEAAPAWEAATSKAADDWISASSSTLLFQAQGAGTTGSAAPTWPENVETADGGVPDNDILWTPWAAQVVPPELRRLVSRAVQHFAEFRPDSLRRVQGDDFFESYAPTEGGLPRGIVEDCRNWRTP